MQNNRKRLMWIVIIEVIAGLILLWHFSMAVEYGETEAFYIEALRRMEYKMKYPLWVSFSMIVSFVAAIGINFNKRERKKFELNKELYARNVFIGIACACGTIAGFSFYSFRFFSRLVASDVSTFDQTLFIATCIIPFGIELILAIFSGIIAYKIHKESSAASI